MRSTTMFARLDVGPGVRFLDIACGAGGVARRAAAMGAEVAGIDASVELIDLAQLRMPEADIRLGSMFELPWPDESFDVVVSINGIWGGNQPALDEAHRVLKAGGRIGISFWGTGPPLDFKPAFRVVAGHSPDAHVGGMRDVNNIAFEGVAEKMLTEAGFVDLERGRSVAVVEWPDPEIAWRAFSSMGPIVPALDDTDRELLKHEVLAATRSLPRSARHLPLPERPAVRHRTQAVSRCVVSGPALCCSSGCARARRGRGARAAAARTSRTCRDSPCAGRTTP